MAPSSPSRPWQRSATLHLGAACGLRCAPCDCGSPRSAPEEVDRALEGGGGRLELRGGGDAGADLASLIRRAREHGWSEIVVRTSALAFRAAEAAHGFAQLGADGVMVPLFSQLPAVHDRIARRPFALVHALAGMKALAQAGLAVEIEVPIFDPRLARPDAVVEQAIKVVPSLRAARFHLPTQPMRPPLAPPPWPTAAPHLARALTLCRRLGVKAVLRAADGVPLCALRDEPDIHDAYRFNPRARSSTWGGSTLGAVCSGCAVRRQCAGIAPSYLAANGETGLAPYARRPRLMYEQRTTRRRRWDDDQRRAASRVDLLVLRPTVNCNQDCTFCSANETSAQVWTDRGAMLRQIARAGRRRILRLSFSGGEPTLSKDLPGYVRAASRCGIPQIELVTNGVLLDSEKKVAALRDAGLTHAFVSLHAHDERLSRVLTRKVGDHARTMQAVRLLLDAGVKTELNHVVNARNYPHLSNFVETMHREFGGRCRISFAFVTPQYKALEDLEQMPRLGEVMPFLRRAMYRALALEQPFVVGSRQGIPPCFLGEFKGWSDVFGVAQSALAEDAPQKQQAEACQRCRFTRQCPGLWRPYAAKYGTDEVAAVPGSPFTDDEAFALGRHMYPFPWEVPMAFHQLPEALRDREAEARGLEPEPPLPTMVRLPVFTSSRSRPLRLLLVGTGRQARRLARAARDVAGISLDAVASPHALEVDLREFGDCPAYADAAEAIDDIRPEGMIVAASTAAHLELARLALAKRVPALVERPLTPTEEEAEALAREAVEAGALLLPAHQDLHAPGLDEILALASAGAASHLRRRPSSSADAPRTWARAALHETLYHALTLLGRAAGGGVAEVRRAQWTGDARPERIRLELGYGDIAAELVLDFSGAADEDALTRSAWSGGALVEQSWQRTGSRVVVTSAAGRRPVEADGSDLVRMLAHFRDVILGVALPSAAPADALEVMRSARRALEALAAAGAPFERPNAPRHVASRTLQPD